MPQLSAKPATVRKIISASMPNDISAADKAALESKWNEAARIRNEAVARENAIPTEASRTMKYQLRKFGRWWNAYARNKKGKMEALLGAPSLLDSAMAALSDRIETDAKS